jgi:hypothetical protein
MARPKTQDLVTAAAEKAVKEALSAQTEVERGDLSNSTQEEMDQEEEHAIQSGNDDADVFDLADERIKRHNDSVFYEIYKDGTRLCTRKHPYSWDQVQTEFGEGLYRVVGKSVRTKRAFKHSTLPVGPAIEKSEAFSFEREPLTPPNANSSMTEIMMFMERQEEKRRRDLEVTEEKRRRETEAADERRREADRDSRDRSANLVNTIVAAASTLLPALFARREETKGPDQTIIDFMRSTVETQNKMIERLHDRVEKSSGNGSSDPMAAYTLMQNLQDRAFSQVKMMEEIATEKAQEIASYSGGGGNEKPKSALDTMLTTMLPAIAQGIVGLSRAQLPPPEDEQEDDGQEEAASQPPRRLESQNPASATPRRVNEAPRAQGAAQARQPSAPRQGSDPGSVEIKKPAVRQGLLGLPSAKPVTRPPVVIEKPTLKAVVMAPEQKVELTMKEKVMKTLIPYLGEALKARTVPSHAAQHSLTLLERAGLNSVEALKVFTWEEIEKVVESYQIPALFRGSVNDWVKQYHTELTQRSGLLTETSQEIAKISQV